MLDASSKMFRTAILIGVCCALAEPASAQLGQKFEIGAQFASMRLSGIETTDAGIGAWAGWRVRDALALEAATDVFLTGRHDVPRGGRKVLALFGPKIGWRAARMGIFGKSRAGFARVGEGRQFGICILIFPPPESCYLSETRLAFDLGGVIEVYASPRITLRADVGDIVSRLGRSSSRFARDGDFSHDLRVAAGAGFRF
jgi:hypothetical protein